MRYDAVPFYRPSNLYSPQTGRKVHVTRQRKQNVTTQKQEITYLSKFLLH